MYYIKSFIVIVFLLIFIPSETFPKIFQFSKEVQASVLLDREGVKKFEGKIAAGGEHSAFLNGKGTVQAVGRNSWGQLNVSGWKDIVALSTGYSQTVGLKSDGTVVAVGENPKEQTNVGEWSDIIQVSAGEGTTFGLKRDGTVVAVGSNYNGQSNVDNWTDIVSVSAGGGHTVGLKSDGTVVAVGDNYNGEINVSEFKNIVAVSAGYSHTVGLKNDGTVIATGDNDYGETNVNEWKDIVAVACGHAFTIGLKSDGTVIAVGGLFPDKINVGVWKDIVAISAGPNHVLGLKSDGTVVSSGYNKDVHTSYSSLEDIVSLSAGASHTVGLKSDGTVVGVGDPGAINISNWSGIIGISAGNGHTFGIKNDGTVVASGENYIGQSEITNWKDIKAISNGSGGSHTVGLKKDGTVEAVGSNYYGQINVSNWKDITSIAAGTSHTVGLKKDGTVVGVGDNYSEQIKVSGWKDIVAIAADSHNTIGLKTDGTVVATGTNYYGQNNVSEWKDIVAISIKNNHTVGLKSDGTVVATGWNSAGQNNVSEWKDIVAISTGEHTTAGLKSDGTLVATGWNSTGQTNVNPMSLKFEAPVSSFDISKRHSKSGDNVTIRVNFNKSMKNTVKLSLRGTIKNHPVSMKEVVGSNGKSFNYIYTVPQDVSGKVHFQLSEMIDVDNNYFADYYANNIFEVDNDMPFILGAASKVIFINSVFNPIKGITATDLTDGYLTNKINISGTVNTKKKGKYSLIYSVVDKSGNETSIPITVTVKDNIKPVILGASDKTVFINSNFDSKLGVTANDNSDGNLTSNLKISGTVNTKVKGVYTLTYTVSDISGNITVISRKIMVVDNVKPVITGAINKTINQNDAFNPKTGVTSKDNVDGNLTNSIKISGMVNTKEKGTYTLKYTVSDSSRNVTTVTRKITVTDNIKPVITGAANKTINIGSAFNPRTGVKAKDNVDGDLTSSIKVIGTVNTKKKGTYSLTYVVTDKSGNMIMITRKISVKDILKPVISGATTKVIKLKSSFNPKSNVTARDNIDGNLTKLIKITGTVNINKRGTYFLTYSVSDKAGNKAVVKRKIMVE